MIMSSGGTTTTAAAAARSSRFPFTAAQWQELEHQALVYKYMISGMPIPPDLLFTIKRSLDSSLSPSSKLLLHHQPQHSIGWNCFQMGFGRKIDPEPGRCRRTDGKKWRCSKEAYPDSKYCERHMHRGRNRSRKPVEVVNILSTPPPPPPPPQTTTSPPPTAIPLSSINSKSPNFSSSSSDLHSHHHHLSYASSGGHNYNIPYPYSSISSSSSNSRPPGIGGNNLSSQDHFLLDPGNPYSHPDKGYRNRYGHDHGMKDEVDELPFFSETSRNINMKSVSMGVDDTWQLEPLTMTMGCPKQRNLFSPDHIQNGSSYSYLQLQSLGATRQQQQQQQQDQYYELPYNFKTCDRSDDQPSQKVMHHFFDEWPHTSSNNKDSSTTQLSISIPNSSHDFFSTHNDK